jgi:hypothetical protein
LASQAFVYNEKIDGKDLDPNDVCCPKCKSKTILLHGKYLIPCREVQVDGRVTDRWTDPSEAAIDVQRIDCLACSITFIVQEPVIHLLERKVLELQQKLSTFQPEVYLKSN